MDSPLGLKNSIVSSAESHLASPAIGSLHGSSEEMSETSDYQRSTPSPRDQDDDLFIGHIAQRNSRASNSSSNPDLIECESSKDLGFVDTIVKKEKKNAPFYDFGMSPSLVKATPTKKNVSTKCSFSPKSFYKSQSNDLNLTRSHLSRKRFGIGSKRTHPKKDLQTIIRSDPKLKHKPLVKLSKLPQHCPTKSSSKVDLTLISDSVIKATIQRVKVECTSPEDSGWCSPEKCISTSTSAASTPSKILRPAKLSLPEKVDISTCTNPFTSTTSTTTSTSLMSNNPFVFKKSSFLFGGESHFQSVDFFESQGIGDVLYIDDDSSNDDSSTEDLKTEPRPHLPTAKASEHIFGTGLGSSLEEDSKDDLKSLLFNSFVSTRSTEHQKKLPESLQKVKTEPEQVTDPPSSNKLRFPNLQCVNNLIPCKWRDCKMRFTTHGKLLDHLKAVHVIGQINAHNMSDDHSFRCLWDGCKVFDMVSSSRCWLEKHVPTHGGKFAYACIVSGCKMRFSTQKMLQRHVNQHFAPEGKGDVRKKSNNSSNFNPYHSLIMRKKVEQTNMSESSKNLRRAGVRLKFRRSVFSARNFDFFDTGIMSEMKQLIYNQEKVSSSAFGLVGDTVTLQSRILSTRLTVDNQTEALVQWIPENILDNEWLPLSKLKLNRTKTLKFHQLPHAAKKMVAETITDKLGIGNTCQRKNRRKNVVHRSVNSTLPNNDSI